MPRRNLLLCCLAAMAGFGLFLAGIESLAASSPSASTLVLKNGDRITGVIVEEDASRVVVSIYGTHVTVPASEVAGRETVSTQEPAVEPAEPPEEPAKSIPAAEPPPRPRRWTGDIQAGVDVGFSEIRRQLYHARLKATYAQGSFRNAFDLNAAYGTTDGTLSANRLDASSKTDYNMSDRVFIYGLAGGGYDEIRRIDLRYEAGPGVGYHIIRRPPFVLDGEIGINYQVQHRTGGQDVQRFYYRFAEQLTWKVTSRLTFDEKLEFFPEVGDLGSFRLRFESNLSYEFRKNIFLNISVLNLYDTQPGPRVPKNDLQIRSSIGVKF